METLTRLVSESLARHGFDRPLDYRRLQWSRWFRCESHHSLLSVPSKPGVFALAEEIMDMSSPTAHVQNDHVENAAVGNAHVATAASAVPPTLSEAKGSGPGQGRTPEAESRKPEALPHRMLAVTQFFEDDDMAFVLDRMLSRQNPMRARLISGRYFVRYVVIEDQSQRRSICAALNQWIVSSTEKVTGIGAHFASSLELTEHNVVRTPAIADTTNAHVATGASPVPRSEASGLGTKHGLSAPAPTATAPQLDSGAATNIHCPSPLPSGF